MLYPEHFPETINQVRIGAKKNVITLLISVFYCHSPFQEYGVFSSINPHFGSSMNKITAQVCRSKYTNYDALLLKIDGELVDILAQQSKPDSLIEGLIPFLSSCEICEEFQGFAELWSPQDGERNIIPVLICPDDCDLYCNLVVADAERAGDKIIWHRLGYTPERYGTGVVVPSPGSDANTVTIDKDVEWLSGLDPYQFELENYQAVVQALVEEREKWIDEIATRACGDEALNPLFDNALHRSFGTRIWDKLSGFLR